PNRSAARWWITALLAASVTATRFESLFLVGCAVLVLLVHHRWRAAIANGCAAVLPVAVNAGYAIAHGGQWLPNSVLLKGNADHPWSIAPTVAKFAAGLHETPQSYVPILVLWITSVILWGALRFLGTRNGDGREDTRAEEAASKETASGAAASGAAASRNSGSRGATGVEASRRTLGSVSRREIEAKLAIFVLTVPLHVHLAELGWFYRYEAYLIAIGTLVVLQGATRLLRELGSHRPGLPGRVGILAASLVLAACLGCPLTTRSIESYRESPLAAQCIYDQPVRLASFLGRYYDGRKVAINDIGAVSYYSDVRSTDLVGLGTNEVARQIEAGTFDFGRYCESEGVEIAIVYPHWYPERPSTWKSAGNWRLARKGPLGGPIINFYGLSEPARTELITHLQEFRDQLPERVAQGGPYIRKLRHQPVRDDDSDVDED
ncbi:MAG: hypothetical protein KC729_16820, partial [Candidatus Eisenbacteria bacterium]|nr:hypothetical protein [Candidatus Eisenbacteria bacterium]